MITLGFIFVLSFASFMDAKRLSPRAHQSNNVDSDNSHGYASALQVEENVTDEWDWFRSRKDDVFFAILADPQLGMKHAYDGMPTGDSSHAAEFHEELDVFKSIITHLKKFEDKLAFVMVSGDMQQYYPTGFNNPALPAGIAVNQRQAVKD